MNCLDCRGVPPGADECTSETFSVGYTCDEGQEFCCTVSNIRQTDFDKPEIYGQCIADNCLPDGSPVTMNLYKDGTDERNTIPDDLEDQCCSGTVSDLTCTSGITADDVPFGSCAGVCGPEETVKSLQTHTLPKGGGMEVYHGEEASKV